MPADMEAPPISSHGRPPTRLSTALNVSGGSPPTAGSPTGRIPTAVGSPRTAMGTSSGRLFTGAKTGSRSGGDGPMTVLAAELIKKMRLKFGDAASNLKGQEIIAQEVLGLINRSGRFQEEDLGTLQERIRGRLTGDTAPKNTMSKEKRQQVEGDEWAKIFEYHIQRGSLEDARQSEMTRTKARGMKAVLEAQMREREVKKLVEIRKEEEYFHSEQLSLREWEASEVQRKQLQLDISAKLMDERQKQLLDKTSRREQAVSQRSQEEARLARRIAYDSRAELQREEERAVQAKLALREYMNINLDNQKNKDAAKTREAEADLEFKRQWEAQLDKQEKERVARLDKMKSIQNKQEALAKERPEAKRWLDQAVIDRYYREAEDARDAEETRRRDKVKAGAAAVKGTLAEQIKEREKVKELQRQADEEKGRALLAKVAADEAREQERRAGLLDKKLKFRADLEAQMRENAARRRAAPMSGTEKLINMQLLHDVQQFEQTGKVILPPV